MSCNPAVGGLAKGQIVREIDALGGIMGLAIDATGIQFRILNRSKGPAVQSHRAQADRHKYAEWMQQKLAATENLTIVEAMATEIITENGKVCGVGCKDGSVYSAETVVLTPGTFLGGFLYMGRKRWSGGRIDEPASVELSDSLRKIGLELGRMATDTTPRLEAASCDLDKLPIQAGDEVPVPFSFMTEKIDRQQVPCWITYTNEKIHQLLRDNLHRASLALTGQGTSDNAEQPAGQITGTDPRYCPSIEGKVVTYADKKQHRIFLEPEEGQIKTIYCNGIFTSMPKDVQDQMMRSLPGTENARIVRYSYAIEYDYCPPIQLLSSLETRKVSGLFLAGQINGTSGYEEAAGQGVIAGINAARKLQSAEPVVLGRDQAYIGVLIDDLRTKGFDIETEDGRKQLGMLNEPYRMFTSRAEYRLSLRADNADRRLTQIGRAIGLVDRQRWERFQSKLEDIGELRSYLQNKRSEGFSMWDRLGQPGNTIAEQLADDHHVKAKGFGADILQAVTIDAKYQGYIAKQQRLVAGFKTLEKKKIAPDMDYSTIEHLRAEAREKLTAFRPATLGQAARISGITPADITVIQIHLRKYH